MLRPADSVHPRALRDRTCQSQYKTDFRYALTHELRTLLRSMHQLTGALATGRAPSETRRQTWYEVLHRESEPLGRLVKRLLDFGRMKAGVLEYRFEILDAGQVIGQVGVRRPRPFALESAGQRGEAFAGVQDGLGLGRHGWAITYRFDG